MPSVINGSDNLDSAVEVADSADSGWITPTLSGTWANLGAPWNEAGYRKVGKTVFLRGFIGSGVIGSTPLFTLPVGYRPSAWSRRATMSNSAFGAIEIRSDGSVLPLLGNTANFSLECSFLVD